MHYRLEIHLSNLDTHSALSRACADYVEKTEKANKNILRFIES